MAKKMIPASTPKKTHDEVKALINEKYPEILSQYKVVLLGMRGYYKKTMGNPDKNDIGLYDDAIFVLSTEAFASYNANTDPSNNDKIGRATLKPGVWMYKKGKHGISRKRPYSALVQAKEVTVKREKKGEETGFFAINIHKGGLNTTGSEGCQTIYYLQWSSFINLVYEQMTRFKQIEIPYILIEE